MLKPRLLLLALLLLIPVAGHGQEGNVPAQIFYALNDLSRYFNTEIGLDDLSSWSYVLDFHNDTALGCALVTGSAAPQGISAYTFRLDYQGVIYDYRVAEDGSIVFPCNAALLEQAPLGNAVPASVMEPCPVDFAGFLAPRLEISGRGRIAPGGTPNRLRQQADLNAPQIGLIAPGTTFNILQGPSCDAETGIIWWLVDVGGTQGWTAEGLGSDYFVEPVASSVVPSERSLINAENVEFLVPLATLPLPGVSALAFNPDGSRLAVAGTTGLGVYELATFQPVPGTIDRAARATQIAFSADDRYLAYSTPTAELVVIDLTSGASYVLSDAPREQVNDLDFSPTLPTALAVASGSTFEPVISTPAWLLYDVEFDLRQLEFPTPSWVRNVAFSPDGEWFAWLDLSVHVADVTTGDELYRIDLSEPSRGGLTWRPQPETAVAPESIAFSDGALVRWVELETGAEIDYSGDADFFPAAISFTPDGTLLAAINAPPPGAEIGSTLNVWDVETADLLFGSAIEPSAELEFSPDGTLLAIAVEGEVILLGIESESVPVG
jgi:hypothetical protein